MFLIVLLIFLLVQPAFSLTTRGRLKHSEVWYGNIQLTGDLIVPENIELRIKPGTQIQFSSRRSSYDFSVMRNTGEGKEDIGFSNRISLLIKGRLIAEGAENKRIIIGNPAEGANLKEKTSWGSLLFFGGAGDSLLKHVDIRYASIGVVTLGDSSPRIESCIIRENTRGIVVLERSSPELIGNQIMLNDISGIQVRGDSFPSIRFNKIFQNKGPGIICYDRSRPVLKENSIKGNRVGIEVYDNSYPALKGNRLLDNQKTVLGLFGVGEWGKIPSSSGRLTRDIVWTGKVRITGDVIVPSGITLVIKPGTHVEFSPNFSDYDVMLTKRISGEDKSISAKGKSDLIVMGTLKVEGKKGREVRFSSPAGTKLSLIHI